MLFHPRKVDILHLISHQKIVGLLFFLTYSQCWNISVHHRAVVLLVGTSQKEIWIEQVGTAYLIVRRAMKGFFGARIIQKGLWLPRSRSCFLGVLLTHWLPCPTTELCAGNAKAGWEKCHCTQKPTILPQLPSDHYRYS
jgi:hypothetical protein